MNPEPQTHDSQLSIDLDWPSDTSLSFLDEIYDLDHLETEQQVFDDYLDFLGLDTCYLDSNAETVQQSIEKSCSETQFTAAEETQTRLIETTQPTIGDPLPIADTKASTPHPIHSTPELAVQETHGGSTREGGAKSKPEIGSMQEIETQLRFLRYKLQKGLLPTDGKPKTDEMKAMSLYLRRLEHIGNPPRSILLDTSITKLLKKIKNLDEIPRNGKFSFKERAARLLEKWRASLEKEDPTTLSTGQPIKHDGIGFNAVADEQKPANTADSQQLLDNETQTSATGLMEECALKMVVKSEQSTNDDNNESAVIPANMHSKPTPPPSSAFQDSSKSTPERLVIDLTADGEVYTTTGSELTRQPTDHQSLGPSVAKSTQATRSPLPSSTNSEPVSTPVRKVQASPKSESGKSNTKKRKRSDADGALVSASNSSARKHSNDNTPNRQRPQRKTSPGEHLTNEILWMSESVLKIEKMIKETEEEIDAIKKKRVRLLEENEAEMQSAQRRILESLNLKEYLLAWGAEDEKVTEEWSSSE